MAGMDHGGDSGVGPRRRCERWTMSGGMNMRDTSLLPPNVKVGPGLDMVAMNPVDRMGYPGLGLDDVDHRVLNYRQLVAAKPNTDNRRPTRLKEIHLTGNMERYMWSFDGKKFSAVSDDPIRFAYNERVRVKLVNDTMMAHPIHLHGHFFELVNGAPAGRQPLKHTCRPAGRQRHVRPDRQRAGRLGVSLPPDLPHAYRHVSGRHRSPARRRRRPDAALAFFVLLLAGARLRLRRCRTIRRIGRRRSRGSRRRHPGRATQSDHGAMDQSQ